jgi:predicted house-cleaning noncanonical NTP pyrophosphatase (MazG superfamily)
METPTAEEAPNGYRIVRIGVRGRKPKIGKTPKEELTPNQLKDYNYRQKHKEKLREYQREYYNKKKLSDGGAVR